MNSETTYLWTTLLAGILAICFMLANCLQVMLVLLACGTLWGLIEHADPDIVYTVHYLLFWLPLGATVLLLLSAGILRLIRRKAAAFHATAAGWRCALLTAVWMSTAGVMVFHPWMPLGGVAATVYPNNTRLLSEDDTGIPVNTTTTCSTWPNLISALEVYPFGAVMFGMSVFGVAQICLVFILFCIVQSVKILCQRPHPPRPSRPRLLSIPPPFHVSLMPGDPVNVHGTREGRSQSTVAFNEEAVDGLPVNGVLNATDAVPDYLTTTV
ncbi:uncharacterized protein LOC129588976 [Paramacrobiotus metropolitanus]|uniref:uncharacterized protein LOC129588976 n=1 Tax=Paramacrobiotus metropolitanus TaxID=2943436 RepID=UPI0024458EC4|nr:uncharacterized protein LOC129588976 [Paramacrobiotus metropolitanus]